MTARVVQAADNVVRIEGELDFVSVIPLRPELERAVQAAGNQVTLDLSGVTRTNSVGLSLVLLVARILETRGGVLRLRGVPAGLQSIANVCELDDWLLSIAEPAPAV